MSWFSHWVKDMILFPVGASIYVCLELLWRGYTHPSMFVLGGMCFICCGSLNDTFDWEMPLVEQVITGTVLVTIAEFLTGCVVNLAMGLEVWDYSELPFNLLGQICLQYCLLWIPLVLIAIVLDDWIRWKFFKEEKPRYKLWN